MILGEIDRLVLYGRREIRTDPESGSTSLFETRFSFASIDSAFLSGVTNEHELYWTITPWSGERQVLRVQAHPGELIFEGRDDSGELVEVAAADIRRVEFNGPSRRVVYLNLAVLGVVVIGTGIIVVYQTLQVVRNAVLSARPRRGGSSGFGCCPLWWRPCTG